MSVLQRAALAAFLATFVLIAPAIAPAAAQSVPAPVTLAQNTNPFSDVPANHWAYDAISQLAADGYIQGYPDGTFKGQRPMTRYEMAALVARAVDGMEQKIAAAQGTLSAKEASDVALLRRLIDAFGPELANVNARIDDLTKRTDALKKEADDEVAQLKAMHVGLDFWMRPGTFSSNLEAVNGGPTTIHGVTPGNSFPGGSGSTSTVGNGVGPSSFGAAASQNSFLAGQYSHGTAYEGVRLLVNGQFDPRFSYALRLAQKYQYDNGFFQSKASPAYCTGAGTTQNSATCAAADVPTNATVNLDYAWVGYFSPGGVFLKLGRYSADEGKYNPTPLLFNGGLATGLQVGYTDTAGRFSGWFGTNYNGESAYDQAALGLQTCTAVQGLTVGTLNGFAPCGAAVNPATGTNTNVSETQQGYTAKADYWFPSTRTDVGATWQSYIGLPFTLWDGSAGLCSGTPTVAAAGTITLNLHVGCPAGTALIPSVSGAYVSGQANIAVGTFFIAQMFGNSERPQFKVVAEYGRRAGSDPFTGAAWSGANSYYAILDYASKGNVANPLFGTGAGVRDSNALEFLFSSYGLNATGNGGFGTSASSLTSPYFSDYAGMQTYQFSASHWLTSNLRAGLVLQHYQLIPGVTIPAGSVSCPGCYVNEANGNAMFFDSYLLL